MVLLSHNYSAECPLTTNHYSDNGHYDDVDLKKRFYRPVARASNDRLSNVFHAQFAGAALKFLESDQD
jgi:hypothetical protein